MRASWVRPLVLGAVIASCGRVGFDLTTSDRSIEILDVQPRWVLPGGGPIDVALAGELDGAVVTLDGVPCTSATIDGAGMLSCTAPPHAPALVEIVVSNALGGSARFTRPFTYITAGMYQLGGALDDRTSGVAVDRDGNVFVTGGTTGDLDGANAGDFDAVVVKYDAAGTVAWIRQLGTPLYDYARDVAVDPSSGAVTIVGYGTGDIDNDGSVAGNDIFVARYSAAGDLQWVTQTGSPGDDQAWDLAVDEAGYTVIAGRTTGAIMGTNSGLHDYVIARYTPTGAVEWIRQVGTGADDYGHSVTVAPDGTAYLVGYTTGTLDVGATNAGMLDLFVARYETDGTRAWIQQRGTVANDEAHDVTYDPAADEVWVAGHTQGALDGNATAGGQDIFVMRFSAAGTWQLTRQYGSAATEDTWGIGIAANGQVYVSCVTGGAFGGQANNGGGDFCMVSLDRSGNEMWTRIIGTGGSDQSSSCALDLGHTGLVYISLITDNSLDGMPNRGGADIAVAKLDAAGMVR